MDANFRSVLLFFVIHILIPNCKTVIGLYYLHIHAREMHDSDSLH